MPELRGTAALRRRRLPLGGAGHGFIRHAPSGAGATHLTRGYGRTVGPIEPFGRRVRGHSPGAGPHPRNLVRGARRNVGDDQPRPAHANRRPVADPGTDDALEITDTRALARTVGGVSLTFRVPRSGWTNGPIVHPPDGGEFRQGGFAITKDTGGFQAAEAVVFWTSFSEGEHVDSCTDLLGPTDGISAADLAFAMATTPRADLVSGPSQVTIDGHRAQHVVITVRDDR